ncbi:MAG: hypothetical protein ACFFEN_06295 [Candidatus Thorarchaeota archaeon]
MTNKKLNDILSFLEKEGKGQVFNLKLETNLLFEILKTNEKAFEKLQNEIKAKWDEFKLKNQKNIIKRTFTSFFYKNFHDFFNYFLYAFFGFNERSLELITKEKVSEKILFLEYNYFLTQEEVDSFGESTKKFETELFYGFFFPLGYLYFLIRLLGTIIRKIIQENIFILLDAVILYKEENNMRLNFMILIKDSKDKIFHSYYNMVLYYFLKQFEGIPEDYYNNLLKGREKLYQIALDEYPTTKERLTDLLYYFYKKCNLLQSFSPLLDFFNFVGARVEDSIFAKVDIIRKEFLANLDEYSAEKKNSIINFFDFLDKKSTLYSTFQANNLPSPKSQLNLFLLYMKYYFGSGLEALEVGDLLFLPEIFKDTLNQCNENVEEVIGSNSINRIKKFLNFLYALSNINNINLFFKKVFKKNISQLNFGFFKTFLKSFNSNFAMKIDQENKHLIENPANSPFTFKIIVDHMCRILYVLINKIFLRATPDKASQNFIDPRSRYIGKNIALRVLELSVFQDINYSDDTWPDYIISLNKKYLKDELKKFKVTIPDSNFYTDEELTQIMLTYNIQSVSDQPYFEEWLIHEIIIPLNNLIINIQGSVKDPSNEIEVYEKLIEFFLSDIENKDIITEFKFICQELAPFWKNLE